MDALICLDEILKQGYKRVYLNMCAKGHKRYYNCGKCHKWTHSVKVPDRMGIVKDECFWCGSKYGIKTEVV